MAVPALLPCLVGKRMLDIAVEPKTVGFEIGAIWAGREQVDSDVMCPVASYWKVERFCEPRDLHKGRDATAIGDIGLGIRHCASRNIARKLPERAQVFARRDRSPAAMMRA